MFGTDTFDENPMSQWTPVIMAVNRYTGEAQVIFRGGTFSGIPDIFPGYPPYLQGRELSGRLSHGALSSKGQDIFCRHGQPTPPLVEYENNECRIAYHGTNYTQGVSMAFTACWCSMTRSLYCLASDNYDGKGYPRRHHRGQLRSPPRV